jgi:hypothetical protein
MWLKSAWNYKPTSQEVQDHKDTRNIVFKSTQTLKLLIWNNFIVK